MRPAQALDFGLCLVAVILIMNQVLLTAQADIMRQTDAGTLEVQVEMLQDDAIRLRFDGVAGRLDQVRPELVRRCAVEAPPSIRLVFAEDTLLIQAHRVYQRLHAIGELACPVAY